MAQNEGGYRYIAERLVGNGAGTILHWDVPLKKPSFTDVLSGPSALTGSVEPEFASLIGDDGEPLIQPWSTALYVEADGQIRGGGIVVNTSYTGPVCEIDCMGFSGYPSGMPYTASQYWVHYDPIDGVREIWSHLQNKVRGDLGMVIDDTTSPVRIGIDLEQGEYDTEEGPLVFEDGPFRLSWYETHDLGDTIDKLAEMTPFDYHEEHSWVPGTAQDISHFLRIGYPKIGERRQTRMVVGENLWIAPTLEVDGENFANEILALGAGEGRNMLHVSKYRPQSTRLRRVRVATDKTATKGWMINGFAERQLSSMYEMENVSQVQLRDEQDGLQLGDEFFLTGNDGWIDYNLWVRILAIDIKPEDELPVTLTIARSDKVTTT